MSFFSNRRFFYGIIIPILCFAICCFSSLTVNAANEISISLPTGDYISESNRNHLIPQYTVLPEDEYNELVKKNTSRRRSGTKSSGTDYYYNQLNATDKLFYTAYLNLSRSNVGAKSNFSIVDDANTYGYLAYRGNESIDNIDFTSIREALNYDHPEELEGMLYNMACSIATTTSGGVSEYAYYCYFTPASNYTGSQIGAMENALQNALTQTYSGITLSGEDANKELAIHDALIEKVEYDHDCADNDSNYDVAHTAYGALVDGSAVCDGYAKAFKMLLQKAGIEGYVVSGLGNGGGHAWNVVKIGSDFYEVDVTWDDQDAYSSATYYYLLSHDYFNRTTADFANHTSNVPGFSKQTTTHIRDARYLGYLNPPVAYGTNKSYANIKGVYKVVFDGVIDGAYVYIRFTDTYTYEGLIVEMPSTVYLSGYTFEGWYTQKNGGTVINKNTVLTQATTAYAHWSSVVPETFTVSFDANGGTPTPDKINVSDGSAIGTLPSVSQYGYDFAGWYDAQTGGNKITATTKIYSDMKLYAHWSAVSVTVCFNINDGISSNRSTSAHYGDTYANALGWVGNITRSGYDFEGWFTDAENGTEITTEAIINTVETCNLYAHWKPKDITVTLNDGNYPYDTITVKVNGKYIGLPASRTKAGYDFSGWYLESNYTTLVTADSVVAYTCDHTLYARWLPGNFTVSFDANGGTPAPGQINVSGDSAIGTLPTVSRYGYDFAGWYDAQTGGNKINDTTKIYSDMTLYAHWEDMSCVVKYDANGGKYNDGTTEKTETVLKGNQIDLDEKAVPSLYGYDFMGWSNLKDSNGVYVETSIVYSDETYYAQWKPIKVIVAFYAEGTTIPYTTWLANFGDTFESVIDWRGTPSLDGYDFEGWYTASEGGVEIKKIDVISSIEYQNLYAHWTQIKEQGGNQSPGEDNESPGAGNENPGGGNENLEEVNENPGGINENPVENNENLGDGDYGNFGNTNGDNNNSDVSYSNGNGENERNVNNANETNNGTENVVPGNDENKGTGNTTGDNNNSQDNNNAGETQETSAPVGTKVSTKNGDYAVTNEFEVTFKLQLNKKVKNAKIDSTVTIAGKKYKVTAIDNNAFKNCKKLKSVTISKNVVTIGKNAFAGCKELKSVTIPSNVTKIGSNAFNGCSKLNKITVKSTKIISIGKNAFKGIKKGAVIKVPKSKKKEYKKLFKKAKLPDSVKIK